MQTSKILVLVLSVAVATSAIAQTGSIRIDDSSDWWSLLGREEDHTQELIKAQDAVPDPAHFQIAGLSLASLDIAKIRAKFGDTTQVERGDAASGRDQLCYVSPSGEMDLIFEFGEVEIAAYLLRDGAQWKGRDRCARSREVTGRISTASGLRLGMSLEQVRRLLGNPSLSTPSRLVYLYEFRMKTSEEELSQFRKDNPEMPDKEIHDNFDYSDVHAYIEAGFTSGRLTYLALSRAEGY